VIEYDLYGYRIMQRHIRTQRNATKCVWFVDAISTRNGRTVLTNMDLFDSELEARSFAEMLALSAVPDGALSG
jgi:hypothetical protein